MGIDHDGTYLCLERRFLPVDGEHSQLYTSGYAHTDFVFRLEISGLEERVFYFVDDFTGTSTPLSQGSTQYVFSVDAENPVSTAPDRFSILVGERLDVDVNEWRWSLALYPNPMDGKVFHIHAPGFDGGQLWVTIRDLSGRILFDQELECRANTLVVPFGEGIATGAYMVTLANNGQSQTYGLMKE